MSAGKLNAPKVITDLNQKVVCLLPTGFYFDDSRWEIIWDHYDKKGDTLTMADLKELFPDEETVQNPAVNDGETFNHKK
jgi:agmatine/peptidylarginine deiminase